MSNYLAIATVTRALQSIVQEAAGAVVPGVIVVTSLPEKTAGSTKEDPVINLVLLQVIANEAFRNEDLPTRTADGTLRQRPRLALDLSYLLIFHGDETALVPQQMLGAVAAELHRHPVLDRAVIHRTVQAAAAGDDRTLAASDLPDQVEKVTLTLQRPTLEELSRLWTALLQAPYALSVLYLASVIFIEPEVTPVPAKTVGQDGVVVTVRREVTSR